MDDIRKHILEQQELRKARLRQHFCKAFNQQESANGRDIEYSATQGAKEVKEETESETCKAEEYEFGIPRIGDIEKGGDRIWNGDEFVSQFDYLFNADEIRKAREKRAVGTIHPNGKWVWTEYAPGKFDWKSLKGWKHGTHKKQDGGGGQPNNQPQQQSTQKTDNGGQKPSAQPQQPSKDISSMSVDEIKALPDGTQIQLFEQDPKSSKKTAFYTFTKNGNMWKGSSALIAWSSNSKNVQKYVKDIVGGEWERRNRKKNIHFYSAQLQLPSDKQSTQKTDNGGQKQQTQPQQPKLTSTEQKAYDILLDRFKISDNKFNDPTKMSISKTPKGNWALSYDGHSVSTISPITGFTPSLAKKMGITVEGKTKSEPNKPSSTQGAKTDFPKNGMGIRQLSVTKLEDGGLATRYDTKTGRVTVGSKQYSVDWEKESLVNYPSGVKVKSTDPVNERFKKLLEENRKPSSSPTPNSSGSQSQASPSATNKYLDPVDEEDKKALKSVQKYEQKIKDAEKEFENKKQTLSGYQLNYYKEQVDIAKERHEKALKKYNKQVQGKMNDPQGAADAKKLEADRTNHYSQGEIDNVSSKYRNSKSNVNSAVSAQIHQVSSSTKTPKGLNVQVGRLLDRLSDEQIKEGNGLTGLKELYNSLHDSDKELSNVQALKRRIDRLEKENKQTTSSTTSSVKVPKGKRINYDDDIVEVYDNKGKKVYSGTLDYCPYKDDLDDNGKWNDKDGNYDLPQGYKMVGK